MVADFWSAIEEAERVRMLGVLGLHELQNVLHREEQRLGVSHKTANLPGDVARDLQAAWERAEMARLEIANGHPHLNAQALLSMNSALDALVEEFAPKMRELRLQALDEGVLRRVEERATEAAQDVEPETRERVLEALHPVLEQEVTRLAEAAESRLPKPKKLRGSGSVRYERVLAQVGLGAPDDRRLPEDLDQALTELGAVRDVLVHRAGRVDTRALDQAPSLPYQDGELVRISGDDYRPTQQQSAAMRGRSPFAPYEDGRRCPTRTAPTSSVGVAAIALELESSFGKPGRSG